MPAASRVVGDVEGWEQEGWTALMMAAEKGHADICTALLKAEARPNIKRKVSPPPLPTPPGRGALLRGAGSGAERVDGADGGILLGEARGGGRAPQGQGRPQRPARRTHPPAPPSALAPRAREVRSGVGRGAGRVDVADAGGGARALQHL
eukprot:1663785-Rhodomonas_salina.2